MNTGHDFGELRRAVALVNGGKSPAEVEAARRAVVRTTEGTIKPPWKGYTWDPAILDKVMKQTGAADARGVIRTAMALDKGATYLSSRVLLKAARDHTSFVTEGVRWSPSALADVMKKTGVAEETAIVRMAKKLHEAHDTNADGDRFLPRAALLTAARVLTDVVDANDLMGIIERVATLNGRPDLTVETLGEVGGLPIDVVRFPSAVQPPKLRVWVSGGVHGDEPCGAGAALLLIEQLAANPDMRQDIEWAVVPVVNPRGFANGTRRTPEDIDLNRSFDEDALDPEEVNLIQAELRRHPVDLALDLHSGGAGRNGFWLLHDGADDIVGPAVAKFAEDWPVLNGAVKTYELEAPGVAASQTAGTLKALAKESGARWAVTVEAPGSVAYREQVLGENDVVHSVVLQARAAVDT